MIEKYFRDSFSLIDRINSRNIGILQVGDTTKHALNFRPAILKLVENNYQLIYKSFVPIGSQHHKEIKIRKTTELTFKNKTLNFYTEGKNVIPSHISIPGFDNPNFSNGRLKKLVCNNITSLSTVKKTFYKNPKLFRAIIPLSKEVRLFGNFTGWAYNVDNKRFLETLMKLKILDFNFDFYVIRRNEKYYFVIDSKQKHIYNEFMRYVNSILLSYGFLKGDYHGEKAYILSFKDLKFNTPDSLKTLTLGGGLYDGFLIHTTNPYNVEKFREMARTKRNKDGNIVGSSDHLKKYMIEFPTESFSNLCELIITRGGILRSVILFVSHNSTTLEMKIPTLYVALENITKALTVKGAEVTKLIDNPKIEQDIKKEIKLTVKNINQIKRDNLPSNLSESEKKEYEAGFARVLNKFHNYNKGTNNKKLIEPFALYGYKLSQEEENLILIDRNKFLHGDDFSNINLNYEFEFRELFHISMKLQKLIAILLLKAAGYSGYILNNAKIYEYISEKNLKENEMIKI